MPRACRTGVIGAAIGFYPGARLKNGSHGKFRNTANTTTTGSQTRASDKWAIHIRPGCQVFQSNIGISAVAVTVSGFMLRASAKSPCNRACRARVVPQPGQKRPVSAWNGHGGRKLPAANGSNHVRTSATANAATASKNTGNQGRAGLLNIVILSTLRSGSSGHSRQKA